MKVSLNATRTSVLVAIVLIVAGLLLPGDWGRAQPVPDDFTEQACSGIFLLKATLVVQGILCLVFACSAPRFEFQVENRFRGLASTFHGQSELSRRHSYICLAVITTIALILRLCKLDSCLWLDEISPITFYKDTSFVDLFTVYYSTNLHLLNTLLVKLSIGAFGEHAWAVRLPAVIFGTATVPALYWTARLALSREASLNAALILCLSYHHIFFSQNGRGYSAYIFFSLISIGFFVHALVTDKLPLWIAYVSSSILNFGSIMASVLVFFSQVIAALVALTLGLLGDRKPSIKAASARLAFVFSWISILGVQLYSFVIPQAIAVMQRTYHDRSAGYFLLSAEFLNEVMRSLREALGVHNSEILLPLVIVAAAVGSFGVYLLFRRSYLLTLSLLLPNVLLAIFTLKEGMVVYPRFFSLLLPLASITLALLIESLANVLDRYIKFSGDWTAGRHCKLIIQSAIILSLAIFSTFSLPSYYSRPKQDYLSAVEFLKPDCAKGYVMVAIYHAEEGFSYYAKRAGLKLDRDFYLVRSLVKLERILSRLGQDKVILVTTFPRALALDHPEIKARIEQSWKVNKVFPGTIGGGDICVWFPVK